MTSMTAYLLLTWAFQSGVQTYNLKLEAFDFQNEDAGFIEHYMDYPYQVEGVGEYLYVRGHYDHSFIRIHTQTLEVKKYGRQGKGPGEFQEIVAMGADQDGVWVLDRWQRRYLRLFGEKGYKDRIELLPVHPLESIFVNRIACSDDAVVTPVHPNSGRIGAIYKRNGKKGVFGEPYFNPKITPHLFEKNPNMNQVIFVHGDGAWFAVYAFGKVIQKYDQNFELMETFDINHGPLIDRYTKYVLDWEKETPNHEMIQVLADAEYFRGKLYVLGIDYLYEIDPTKGRLESITRFHGVGDNFPKNTRPLAFMAFTFTDDGTLYLSHPTDFHFGHDLLRVPAPPFLN